MVIRMKEWGMLAQPKSSPNLPTKGIYDMARANEALASSIKSAGKHIAPYIGDIQNNKVEAPPPANQGGNSEKEAAKLKVSQMGALASLAENLQVIATETADELEENKVTDWKYAWENSASPRIVNAISQLPAEHQQAGNLLANRFNQQASIKAQRQHELKEIEDSRNLWNTQVESAIQNGKPTQAERWLVLGKDTFVPEAELEPRRLAIRSKCQLQEQQLALESSPIQALAEMHSNDYIKPELLEEDASRLQDSVISTRRVAKEQIANDFKTSILRGGSPDKAAVQLATQAKLISQEEVEDYPAGIRGQLTSLCSWIKRIDESPLEQVDQRHDLEIELATSALPHNEKMKLIERIDIVANIPSSKRIKSSREIWNFYYNAHFGSPGDKVSLTRLQETLESQIHNMESRKDDETPTWMQKNSQKQNIWITYTQPTYPSSTNETIS